MKKNIGKTDRIIRFIGGAALIIISYFLVENVFLKVLLIIAGIISIIESFTLHCYIYEILKINTAGGKK